MSGALHRSAAAFGRAAAVYDRARPEYPDVVVDELVAALGVAPGDVVADVGAGTGKLSRPLLARGVRVVAVEPVEGMRALLPAEADVRAGTGEALPLADDSVGGVVAGQAFHWFANDAALEEVARVLRPGGRLGLVWNTRDSTQPLQRAVREVLEPYRADEPRQERWEDAFVPGGPFRRVRHTQHPWVQRLSRDGLVERALSTSFIAALPDAERDVVAARVRVVADAHDGPLGLAYVGELFVYEPA